MYYRSHCMCKAVWVMRGGTGDEDARGYGGPSRETEREREHRPVPWLTAQQCNGMASLNYSTLRVILLRHLPTWTPATPTLALSYPQISRDVALWATPLQRELEYWSETCFLSTEGVEIWVDGSDPHQQNTFFGTVTHPCTSNAVVTGNGSRGTSNEGAPKKIMEGSPNAEAVTFEIRKTVARGDFIDTLCNLGFGKYWDVVVIPKGSQVSSLDVRNLKSVGRSKGILFGFVREAGAKHDAPSVIDWVSPTWIVHWTP
ncbi:hypothetical protein OG21DRAFT_1521875 [Imleria badia]|nr:hypothetical protein OG21DRAFT_1521875 [Imleria badia]